MTVTLGKSEIANIIQACRMAGAREFWEDRLCLWEELWCHILQYDGKLAWNIRMSRAITSLLEVHSCDCGVFILSSEIFLKNFNLLSRSPMNRANLY